MNSVRERVLREIVTRLASAIAPTPVLRMPAVPVTREASPALLLFVDGDSITAHANHLVDRLLIVRLAVVARGTDAFDVADRALVDLQHADGRHARSQRAHHRVPVARRHAGIELLLGECPARAGRTQRVGGDDGGRCFGSE